MARCAQLFRLRVALTTQTHEDRKRITSLCESSAASYPELLEEAIQQVQTLVAPTPRVLLLSNIKSVVAKLASDEDVKINRCVDEMPPPSVSFSLYTRH
jgi:hypothetical protein